MLALVTIVSYILHLPSTRQSNPITVPSMKPVQFSNAPHLSLMAQAYSSALPLKKVESMSESSKC